MVIRGRVKNGVIVLDNASALPEGAEVSISYPAAPEVLTVAEPKRVDFPLVYSERPGTVALTAERVANFLDEEDVSS